MGRVALHELATACDGREREAVGDRLAQRRDVRQDTSDRLIAAEVMAQAGDDLVEDEHGALAVAQAAQALEEARLRHQPRRVVRHRLDDDRGDLLAVLGEHRLDVVEVVEAGDQGRVDRSVEHPRGLRVAPADQVGRAEDVAQDVVVKAVVTALELQDLLAPGDPAGQADRVVGRLRAAVAHEDLLGARDVLDDLARERDLGPGHAGAEEDGFAHRVADAVGHGGVRVTEEDRAVGGVVVDVAAAIEVPQVGALPALEAQALRALAPAGVHAARDDGRSFGQ
jgi:hypothetical protein